MANDRRKKGCPNSSCERNKNKVKLPATEEYCPKCGTNLVYVCKKCFCQIEDTGREHTLCLSCQAQKEERNKKIIDKSKNIGTAVLVTAGTVATGIITKAAKVAENETTKKITGVITDAFRKH
ncbi:MAG: hypothetical protein IKZ41_07370 [Clostridia bacterium]|nr:hypothetical protein [Clostridia bacterium]MBR5365533.1 hypothetical protein [Clostridia bacterium]